jgi:hypothetical protein
VAAAVLGGARPAGADCGVIDDFSGSTVGAFPAGWKLREEEGRGVYTVQEEGGRRFLRASSRGLGIQAAKEYDWDLARYPVLAWSWRPLEFPPRSDERNDDRNDSALAVYAVFPHTRWAVKSLKYVWSALVPAGERLSSSKGLTQVRVLRTKTDGNGQWVDQRVNVLEDYRRFFETTDVPRPAGIAVLSDADDTKGRSRGDYANFRACAS